MSPLLRRRHQAGAAAPDQSGVAQNGTTPRRPHAGVLRRERRALLKAREARLRDLGGLLVEMYRRGGFRDDLLAEGCADIVGIDARLAELEELLHARAAAPRCECGAPLLRGAHFCANCGRPVPEPTEPVPAEAAADEPGAEPGADGADGPAENGAGEETVIEQPREA